MNARRILEFLHDDGHLSEGRAEALLGQLESPRETSPREFLDRLVQGGVFDERAAALPYLARHFGLEFVDLEEVTVEDHLVDRLDGTAARRYGVCPLRRTPRGVEVAVSEPPDVGTTEELEVLLGDSPVYRLADPKQLERLIRRRYGTSGDDMNAVLEEADHDDLVYVHAAGNPGEPPEPGERARQASVINLVNRVLTGAVRQGASDIHFEPRDDRFLIRHRIDGVLHAAHELPESLGNGVVSRLKIMAEVDVAERRTPQDGRIRTPVRGKEIDFRVSTLPSIHGESVVLRILDRDAARLELEELGFLPGDQTRFEELIHRPHGMVLVTGPTGSGKTTTLYSALSELNTKHRKLVSVEDPVEYQVEGINQMQVNHGIGLDFALGLRTLLRQNPDVVLVGEIRDPETADIAMRAALTGHLVFSTLHTGDAAGAVDRLIDLGVTCYRLAAALQGVMSQRLVRTVCPDCREPYDPDGKDLDRVGFPPDERAGLTLYRGTGCSACRGTGYAGRTALFELLVNDDGLSDRLRDGARSREIRARARDEGMRPLRRDGFEKVRLGRTTLMEVARVTRTTGPLDRSTERRRAGSREG